jgi:hypothetical protein
MMGEEIERGFTISDFQVEDQINLTLEEISEGSHLKNDVAFALLIIISPHTIIMLNKIDHFHGLDAIFNSESIGLENCINQ